MVAGEPLLILVSVVTVLCSLSCFCGVVMAESLLRLVSVVTEFCGVVVGEVTPVVTELRVVSSVEVTPVSVVTESCREDVGM